MQGGTQGVGVPQNRACYILLLRLRGVSSAVIIVYVNVSQHEYAVTQTTVALHGLHCATSIRCLSAVSLSTARVPVLPCDTDR